MDSSVKIKKTWFIQSREGKIEDFYNTKNFKEVLGSGTYGSVIKASTKEGNQLRAIKVIPKSKVKDAERFKSEIEILAQLDHPNIIKLYETFEDNRHVYLVTELCKGGELFDRIISKGHFTEAEARNTFIQIMHAINYCHTNQICHRDLKPENFLLLDERPETTLKVIDFGLSKVFSKLKEQKPQAKVSMTTRAGTPYYISPEVLAGNYDESCDIWSAGVILYILLCGYPPFYGNTDAQILEAVKKGYYDFSSPEWKDVSESAKDLIKKMLCKPDKRLKADAVLRHPWMVAKLDKKDEKPLKLNYQMLRHFRNSEKLKKVALTFIASQMSESEIGGLAAIFHKLDKNGDGVLTFEEMQAGLSEMSDKAAKEIKAVIDSIDTDKSGTINYTEFIAATMERSVYLKEEKLWAAFKLFDKDGNGKISASELRDVLGADDNCKNDIKYYEQMIKEADLNGDGEIDYSEFIKMMSSNK